MKYADDTMTFETTGRSFYCFGEGLSCHPSDPETLYYGSDGGFGYGALDGMLTREERREAAEWMIGQWKEWLAAGEAPK